MGAPNTVVVGRDAEVGAVEALLDAPAPAGLVLEGEPGIGKSTIWAAGVALAQARGATVLEARPAEAEAALSLNVVGDLLQPVAPALLAALPTPLRRALGAALLLEGDGYEPDTRAVSLAVLGALRELTSKGQVVIAIDDFQWTDSPSATLISFALRRLRTERLAVLVTRRGTPDTPLPLGLDRAFPEDRLRRLHVGPLSLGALGVLLRERLDTRFPRPVLRRLRETSGGNPFFALELGRALLRSGLTTDAAHDMPVPQTLRVLVRDRLAMLPTEIRDSLLIAAVAANPSQDLLRAVERRRVELGAAEDAGVVRLVDGRIEFTHPLLAAALVDAASPSRLRDVHAGLASTAATSEERARHLAAATDGADERVADALADAAREARGRGATTAAAELAEEAFVHTPAEQASLRARRAGEAGTYHVEAGNGDRAEALLHEAVEAAPPGRERALALLRLVDNAITRDEPDDSYVRAAIEESDDGEVQARAHWALSWIAFLRRDLRTGLDEARLALAAARELRDTERVVRVLAEIAYFEAVLGDGDPDETIAEATRLEQLAPPSTMSPVAVNLGHLLIWRDELDQARVALERAYKRARDLGLEESVPAVCAPLARCELRAGRWENAARYAEEGFEIADQGDFRQLVGAGLWACGTVAAYRGELELARDLLLRADEAARASGDLWYPLYNAVSRLFVELSASRFDAAADVAAELSRELEGLEVHEPGIFPYEADAAEVFVAVGRSDEAERLARALEERGRAAGRPRALATAARSRGLIELARGRPDDALTEVERALLEHDRFPDPFERTRTLLMYGRVLRHVGRKRDARNHLDAALGEFERLGARAWVEHARNELRRVGGRARADGLTPTEQRVASLVAEGLSNKDVAATLVVGVGTVETHLTSIYAKLGIRSRTELARRLAVAPVE